MSLTRSTLLADSVRPECLCVKDCDEQCHLNGGWHSHPDEVCPIHPDPVAVV